MHFVIIVIYILHYVNFGFLNIEKRLQDLNQNALGKSKNTVKISKLKISIVSEKNKISKMYDEIGREYLRLFQEELGESHIFDELLVNQELKLKKKEHRF